MDWTEVFHTQSCIMHRTMKYFKYGRNYAVSISVIHSPVVIIFVHKKEQTRTKVDVQIFGEGGGGYVPKYQYTSACHEQNPQVPLHPFLL